MAITIYLAVDTRQIFKKFETKPLVVSV